MMGIAGHSLAGLAFLALSSVGLFPAAAQASSFAFVDVNVLPMDRERVLKSQTIVVRDGSIVAFGPKEDVAVPEGATQIEGAGRLYVMPGLADMHIHLRREGKAWLPLYLAAGVTTVLNMGGTKNHLAWRQQVIEGNLVGPTIYSAGPQIGKSKPLTSDQAERLVVEHERAGYDFIKVYSINPGHWSRETSGSG